MFRSWLHTVLVLEWPENDDDLDLLLGDLGWGSGGHGVFAHARFFMSPHTNRGLVPGAEGMRARPTSPFSHYFSKGK